MADAPFDPSGKGQNINAGTLAEAGSNGKLAPAVQAKISNIVDRKLGINR